MNELINISSYEVLDAKPYDFQKQAVQSLLSGNDIYAAIPGKSGKSLIPLIYYNIKRKEDFHYLDRIFFIFPESSSPYLKYLYLKNKIEKKLPWIKSAFITEGYQNTQFEYADIIFTDIQYLYKHFYLINNPKNITPGKIMGLIPGSLIVFDDINLINKIEHLSFLSIFRKQFNQFSQFCFFSSIHIDRLPKILKYSGDFELITPSLQDWNLFPVTNSTRILEKIKLDEITPDFIIEQHFGNTLVVVNSAIEAQKIYLNFKKSKHKVENLILLNSLMIKKDLDFKIKKICELANQGEKTKDFILITDTISAVSLETEFMTVISEITSYSNLIKIFSLSIRERGGQSFITLITNDKIKNNDELNGINQFIRNKYKDFSLLNEWAVSKRLKYKKLNFLNYERLRFFEEEIAEIHKKNFFNKTYKIIKSNKINLIFGFNHKKNTYVYNSENHISVEKNILQSLLNNHKHEFYVSIRNDKSKTSINYKIKDLEELNKLSEPHILLLYSDEIFYSEETGLITENKEIQFLKQFNIYLPYNRLIPSAADYTEKCTDCIYKAVIKKHRAAFLYIRKKYGYLNFEYILAQTINIVVLLNESENIKFKFERLKNFIKKHLITDVDTPIINEQNKDYITEILSNMFIWYELVYKVNLEYSRKMLSSNEEFWLLSLVMGIIMTDYNRIRMLENRKLDELKSIVIEEISSLQISKLEYDFKIFLLKINNTYNQSFEINEHLPIIWMIVSILDELSENYSYAI